MHLDRALPLRAPSASLVATSLLAVVYRVSAVLSVAVILATPLAAAPTGLDDGLADEVVDLLAPRFEILALSNSYVLNPSDTNADFDLLEVRAGEILADGEPAGPDLLEDLLGRSDAELVRILAGLEPGGDPEALRSRFTDASRRREAPEDAERDRLDAEIAELDERLREQLEEAEQRRAEIAERIAERRAERRERQRPGAVRVRSDTRFSLGSSITIAPDESARDVVVVGGSIDIDGEVRGDAVAVLGSIEVDDVVDGAVTAVMGSVSLGPNARIDGDVVSVGGAVDQHADARIDGEVVEIAFAPGLFDVDDLHWPLWHGGWGSGPWFGFSWPEFFQLLINTAGLTVLLLLCVMVAPRYLEGIAERSRLEPWKAGLVGLLVEVLFLPMLCIACLLLLISVVGIPFIFILLPLSILGLFVLLLLGYGGVALALGRVLQGRGQALVWSPYVAILVGILMIQVWEVFGEGMTIFGGPVRWTAYLIIVFGLLLKYCVWTVGLGAVVLQRFSPLAATGGGGTLPPIPVPPPTVGDPFDPPSTDLAFDLESPPPEEDPDAEYATAGEADAAKKADGENAAGQNALGRGQSS